MLQRVHKSIFNEKRKSILPAMITMLSNKRINYEIESLLSLGWSSLECLCLSDVSY